MSYQRVLVWRNQNEHERENQSRNENERKYSNQMNELLSCGEVLQHTTAIIQIIPTLGFLYGICVVQWCA